ncbi:MAG: hypothetical protein PGN16_08085 [Sphingomonas phyllosphaerae]|uniref:hypothetical protein n=1 Tax=Sphingomonas phyllosphaerae TaxID=257003 RepID=UPI002FFB82C4
MTRHLSSLPLALLVLGSAACVPRAVPPAPVARTPAPAPAPEPLPAPAPVADWQDWPWTPGAWRYVRDAAGPRASYGVTGQAPAAELRCDRAARALLLSRPGNDAAPFTIRTSAMTRNVATQPAAGAVPQVVARFALDDRLLDAMAFTRGRFTVEQPGAAPLVLPPWAEVGRVIEDCRG